MSANQTIDRRIARTRSAIRDALVSLIKEKGFDAVTVRDIVDRAKINRGTFYLHYKDKFDLLEKTEAETFQDLQALFLQASSIHVDDENRTDQLQRLVTIILEYVKDHAELMQAILGLQGDYSFITRVRGMMEQNLDLGVLAGFKAENLSVPREYLMAYITHAHLGTLQLWLVSGCKESPQEIARILFRLSVEGPLHAAGFGSGKAQTK